MIPPNVINFEVLWPQHIDAGVFHCWDEGERGKLWPLPGWATPVRPLGISSRGEKKKNFQIYVFSFSTLTPITGMRSWGHYGDRRESKRLNLISRTINWWNASLKIAFRSRVCLPQPFCIFAHCNRQASSVQKFFNLKQIGKHPRAPASPESA